LLELLHQRLLAGRSSIKILRIITYHPNLLYHAFVRFLVSYSTRDAKEVRAFRDLVEPKLKVSNLGPVLLWQDYEIPLGLEWEVELLTKLREVDGGLVMLSPNLLLSEWALREVAELQAQGKILLPILLEWIDPKRMDMKGLDRIQYFGLIGKTGRMAFTESHRATFAKEAFKAIYDRLLKETANA
jgi:hypothetical protein